ncbi:MULTISPECIES: restriction endonuclease [Haloferacaceae]|uniref:Restriction endonuclease n=1 Tax=Halorubrum glutamatedens TaxID=2707018 RepID=A0ABD5QNQ0_9EURY|nr:restriction endonuclease [Halobellus captivus]
MGLFGEPEDPPWDKSRLQEVGWRELELLIGAALDSKGYDAEVTPAVKDGGVDVDADRIDVLKSILFRPKIVPRKRKLVIDAKQWSQPVGKRPVENIAETAEERGGTGVIASPSGFTTSAKEMADEKGVKLYDADRILELLNTTEVEVPDVE